MLILLLGIAFGIFCCVFYCKEGAVASGIGLLVGVTMLSAFLPYCSAIGGYSKNGTITSYKELAPIENSADGKYLIISDDGKTYTYNTVIAGTLTTEESVTIKDRGFDSYEAIVSTSDTPALLVIEKKTVLPLLTYHTVKYEYHFQLPGSATKITN